jgi:hypothetical protein
VNPDDKANSNACKPEGMIEKIRKSFSPALGYEPIIAMRDVEILVWKEPASKTYTNKKQRQYKTKYCHKQHIRRPVHPAVGLPAAIKMGGNAVW